MKNGEQELWKYLKTHRMMQIATSSPEPWICTVLYAFDTTKKFYFISSPDAEHSKAIATNNVIACAITDTSQKVIDKKKGVQLRGIATLLTGDAAIKRALDLWNKANPGITKATMLKSIKKGESHIYSIKPTRIKFFNEKIYGEEGSRVFELT